MLEMPADWRFGNPGALSFDAMNGFHTLVLKVTGQGSSWDILEVFKTRFTGSSSRSTNASWAGTDLFEAMNIARLNAPTFIDAFWAGLEDVATKYPSHGIPNLRTVNAILVTHSEPYEITPPRLILRQTFGSPTVNVPETTVDEKARALIEGSLERADRLLQAQHPRQAVQEILWLLETVATAFDGRESGSGTVEGKYFNVIVRELIKHGPNTMLGEVVKWISKLHGYLSSPSGGGVRHGTDLAAAVNIDQHEARLYCNLTKSYIDYLLAELSRMPKA
jgi:hypothetical protein